MGFAKSFICVFTFFSDLSLTKKPVWNRHVPIYLTVSALCLFSWFLSSVFFFTVRIFLDWVYDELENNFWMPKKCSIKEIRFTYTVFIFKQKEKTTFECFFCYCKVKSSNIVLVLLKNFNKFWNRLPIFALKNKIHFLLWFLKNMKQSNLPQSVTKK